VSTDQAGEHHGEYFTGRKDVGTLTLEPNKGKAVLECNVSEYWFPLLHDSVKCGAQVTDMRKKTAGIGSTEKVALENSLHGAVGLKDLAQIKAVAKEQVSVEPCRIKQRLLHTVSLISRHGVMVLEIEAAETGISPLSSEEGEAVEVES
jgi:hypothetical protein